MLTSFSDHKINNLKSYLEFEVQDTGIGIKLENQPKLFTLFGMVESNKHINPNGSGIGLTVSRKYAESLGGAITLSSEWGRGTTVKFSIEYNEKSKSVADRMFDPPVEVRKKARSGVIAEDTDIHLESSDFKDKECFVRPLLYTSKVSPNISRMLY